MPLRRSIRLAAAFSIALAVSACGGSSTAGQGTREPSNAAPDLVISAPGGLKFDAKEYSAKAGQAKLNYANKDSQVHNLVIQDAATVLAGARLKAGPGETVGSTYNLKPGTYAVFCDIPGHKASMNAKLVVT